MGHLTRSQSPTSRPHAHVLDDDEEEEHGHHFPEATRKAAIERANRIAQAPTVSPAAAAHQKSDSASAEAAMEALEHYASGLDGCASYMESGSAHATGPGENTVFDNLNGGRDLTVHMLSYLKGLGLSASVLRNHRAATMARVDAAIAHFESALQKTATRPPRGKPGDADPLKLKGDLLALRGAIGSKPAKAVLMTKSSLTELRDTSLLENLPAATAAITSIRAGNHGDIERLAAHLREIALEWNAVKVEKPGVAAARKAALGQLVMDLDALERAVPGLKSHARYAPDRKVLEAAIAKEPFER